MENTKIFRYGVCQEYIENICEWFLSKYDGVSEVSTYMIHVILTFGLVLHVTKDPNSAVAAALECNFMKMNFQNEEIQEACQYAKDLMDTYE